MTSPAKAIVAVSALLLTLTLGSTSASAVQKRFHLNTFGSFGSAQALAVDGSAPGAGDVYVLDVGSSSPSIQRFDSAGNPAPFSALNGSNDIDGSDAGSDADQTPQNGFDFDQPSAAQVAIDSSSGATDGDIYVTTRSTTSSTSSPPQARIWAADRLDHPASLLLGAVRSRHRPHRHGLRRRLRRPDDRYAPSGGTVLDADYETQISGIFGTVPAADSPAPSTPLTGPRAR